MLSSVCGIKPADIGFNAVKIKPHLGKLEEVKAEMPHPKGRIEVEYKKVKRGLRTRIILPDEITGIFEWNGTIKILNGGENEFTL
ncbi:alpha-L-rhamnosidase C-terminal domain-containing protein [Anaerorudis cellulosivorans]|uniref:alpha-L-rhamnosidase C-terminal domain-containing protein n=1 Tax=Anaerorudis cellulosivorans TaxID=3397862 RepID=UPI00221FD38B|nr:alpha-L-rhamnosidase C-terminal domain-containing protein [Seramator thermalis]MCW1735464.1 hypothetical protein [Seramator thermalis]